MNQRQRLLTAMFLMGVACTQPSEARIIDLLPKPHHVVQGSGTLTLPQQIEIADEHQTPALVRFATEFGSTATFTSSATAQIKVRYVSAIAGTDDHTIPGYESEAYRLDVTADGVTIEAVSQVGVIRAAQTLTQMAEGWGEAGVLKLECATVTDWTAFKVRGYMHDVGRSFISVETLKKHIRLLSRFKINTFHWHMTENQAWRFEVKHPAYAKLTDAAYMTSTRFPGKYYTQEDCREVERYAREHGVTVIPEIDMPGHSEAFERALGYTMQSEQGTAALKVILSEVAQVFSEAPYIHIGADEKHIERLEWLNGMVNYVKDTLGRKCVLWNPIRNIAVANTTADMTHMWGTAGRAVSGKYNIDSRYNYTNHFDVYADLVGIYKSNIYYESKGTPTVAGTISAAWNDRLTPTEDDIVRQNNFYANVIATGVRAWTGGGERYIDNMNNGGTNGGGGTTLPNEGAEYEDFKEFETRFLFHKAHSLVEEAKLIPYVVPQSQVRWLITDAFPNNGNTSAVFPPEQQRKATQLPTMFEYNGKQYGTRLATGAGIYLRHTWGHNTINSFYTAPAYNQTAYAWTYVYAPEVMLVGAQIEFYNYSRSERDAVPTSGWDFYGSRIWVNDTELSAPSFTNGGKSISNEMPLTNENFTGRPMTRLRLRKGWNKVFIKLPYVDARYRLDKWQFTLALTDTAGVKAVEGLVYSPYKLMDDKATLTQAAITEAKQLRAQYIGTEVGYYTEQAVAALDAVLAEVERTLEDVTLTAEQRDAQRERLNVAVQQFKTNLPAASVVQPQEGVWYDLYTPNRNNRYMATQANGNQVVSEATPSERTAWRFVKRTDQTWDIVNSNGAYLAPTAAFNSGLTTSVTAPTRGWTLSAAATLGAVIVTSGEVQLNQTNAGLGWSVYNWGRGNNTTDSGCQYLVRSSTYSGMIAGITKVNADATTSTYYDLLGRRTIPINKGVYVLNGHVVVR